MHDSSEYFYKLAKYAARRFPELKDDAISIALTAIITNKRQQEAKGKQYSGQILLLKAYSALSAERKKMLKCWNETDLNPHNREDYQAKLEQEWNPIEEFIEVSNREELIKKLFSTLTEEERLLINHKFGLGEYEKLTPAEIKTKYQYKSRVEIERKTKAAMEKLKEWNENKE